MTAPMVCFACKAIKRTPKISTADRYRLAIRCVCGQIEPGEIMTLRAELNALEPQAGQS